MLNTAAANSTKKISLFISGGDLPGLHKAAPITYSTTANTLCKFLLQNCLADRNFVARASDGKLHIPQLLGALAAQLRSGAQEKSEHRRAPAQFEFRVAEKRSAWERGYFACNQSQ